MLISGDGVAEKVMVKQEKELSDTSNSRAANGVNTSTFQLTWNSTRFYGAAVRS
jgi:hypothetical protein